VNPIVRLMPFSYARTPWRISSYKRNSAASPSSSPITLLRRLSKMSAASASASGLSVVQNIFSDAIEVPSNGPPNAVTVQNRQYEGCTILVPEVTWLAPSYTACIVQQTATPCGAPHPPSTCPVATPTPQSQPPKSNSDSSQTQSWNQSNTSSNASVSVSGAGGSGSQSTAIIVGVTIGAVVLLIVIVVLAVQGAGRRHRRTPRSERGNILGPNYLTAGIQPDVRAHEMYGHQGPRPTGGGGGGGNGGGRGAPGRNGTGDGMDTGVRFLAGVERNSRKGPETRAERDVPRDTPAPASNPQQPAEIRKADISPVTPFDKPRSRRPSSTRRSRSRYRPKDHGEHPENDHLYSPGPRRERLSRREQQQQQQGGGGSSADEYASSIVVERKNETPNKIPLRDVDTRLRATEEPHPVNGDGQSPSTGRWKPGKSHVPYAHQMAEEDESTA